MIEFFCLGAILLLRVVQSISGKSNSNEMPTHRYGVISYMSLRMAISGVAALLLLLFSGNCIEKISSMSTVGWLIAIATGVTLTVTSICSLLVLKKASVVLGTLFSSAGLLVPTISGIFILGQSVGIGQWIGIVFLFVAALLLSSSSNETNGKLTAKAFVLLFLSMLGNGGTMLLQTLFKKYAPEADVSVYSFLQFTIPAVVLFILAYGMKLKDRTHTVKYSKKLIVYTVLASVAVFGISQISTIVSEFIPVAVLFPISDGGGTVISALVAAIVYKEKITVKSALGVIVGVAALCSIKLFG